MYDDADQYVEVRPPASDKARMTDADRHAAQRLVDGRHDDAFAFLGPHQDDVGVVIRTYVPGARGVRLLSRDNHVIGNFQATDFEGLFIIRTEQFVPYRLQIDWPGGLQITEDPYGFGALLGDLDLHLIAEGRHRELAQCLGARHMEVGGTTGVRFAVWAPNAMRVSVVGDFNSWDGRRHPMRRRHAAGVWELFLPDVAIGASYKYEIISRDGYLLPLKADPLAMQCELAPRTASVVANPAPLRWTDQDWMARRPALQSASAPISIYEMHASSWQRLEDGGAPDWNELSGRLIPYCIDMGFTHIELMPIMEHPFGGSWGYQPLGLFAPSARYGRPEDFGLFVDRCHAAGLGVILDWVPAHFPNDAYGMVQFDGTALYEYGNPHEGWHADWNTVIYNFSRHEVRGFLIASALHWLEHYHVDGLRVDAVASMLYRDYSRKHNEWVPNIHGGRENLEAVAFLKELNQTITERCPGAIMIAEESTAWPGVTAPVHHGGLGFAFKWNMGWMHDSLNYMAYDPIYRRHHHDEMTFSLVYSFSERFVLPISHDEVVHGKGTLLGRMPGDRWQKFANLRAYLGFMWTHPGKKLLFMGSEIGQAHEWNHDWQVDWAALQDPMHQGVQKLVRDLNRLYRNERALHAGDADPAGFEWLVGDDRDNSVFAFARKAPGASPIVVVCNMTPVVRHDYRIAVPDYPERQGAWLELLNSDSTVYGGANNGNSGRVVPLEDLQCGASATFSLTLPPLAILVLGRQ